MHIVLGPDARAPSRARQALRGELGNLLEPEALERATLLVSELVTNSVRHACLRPDQSIELTVELSPDGLRVEVSEEGDGFAPGQVPEPAPRPALTGPDSAAPNGGTGGWGLFLVDRMARSWGIERNGGTRVWFELSPE